MRPILKSIRVKDKNGVLFLVVERELVDTTHGRERKTYRFELENGQVGTFVDYNTFVVGETGDKYLRVTRTKSSWITES